MEKAPAKPGDRTLDDLVFVAFNSRVIALDRYTGEEMWNWKSPEGSGMVTLLLDGDRLLVSVIGYTYCLDPLFGQEVWRNTLKGYGTGVASLASVRGGATDAALLLQEQARQQAAAAAVAGGAVT